MQTRKDLYQAHKLMTKRVGLALLTAEPDTVESPMRRLVVAWICGVMVAVLVVAGFGIWGLIFKGGAQGLEKPGTLIIESETGGKFAYSRQDRKLIPFLNYASARLAMPDGQITQRSVSRASLTKYVRGPLVGIPGAPDSLPDRHRMARAPWSLCVRATEQQNGTSGEVVSLLGGRDVGGRSLDSGSAVVLQGGTDVWLVWNNQRMRISLDAVRQLTPDPPTPVAGKWLNGIPQGPDFTAPTIAGRGGAGPGPDGPQTRVGRVFSIPPVAGSGERWYVQLPDGLAPVSQTEANLLINDPLSKGLPGPRTITPADAASNQSKITVHGAGLPDTMPKAVAYDASQPLCVVYPDTDKRSVAAHLSIGGTLPDPRTFAVVSSGGATSTVDQVVLPGGGTFAGVLPGPGQAPQSYCLVTDQGVRFPVPSAEDAGRLGYDVADAAPVPANLLRLLPEGPSLDHNAALIHAPTSAFTQ